MSTLMKLLLWPCSFWLTVCAHGFKLRDHTKACSLDMCFLSNMGVSSLYLLCSILILYLPPCTRKTRCQPISLSLRDSSSGCLCSSPASFTAVVLHIGSQLRGRDWREACWGRDPEKFCALLLLSRLSLHNKVMQCTGEGSQRTLAPQTLCSPEFKTESPHLFTHHSPSHLGSRPPKWLAWGFTSVGPGEVSFIVALWMGQDFVIGSWKRRQRRKRGRPGNGEGAASQHLWRKRNPGPGTAIQEQPLSGFAGDHTCAPMLTIYIINCFPGSTNQGIFIG